jgi:two-component system sensor histidine kinase MprB
MSLRVRLALVVATTFAAVVVACVFAAHVSARNQLRAETDRFLAQRASDPHFARDGDRDERGGRVPTNVNPDATTQFIRADGSVVGTTPGQAALPVDTRDRALAAHGGKPRSRDAQVDGNSYRILTMPLAQGGALQVGRSIEGSDHVLSTLDTRLVLIALIGTFIAALAAWLIARRIVRPVERLTGAAEHVAQTQDLASHIDVERSDELGRLAESFNTMLAALETSRDQQQRLVMDASHELRTPLTALRTNMEVLQRNTAIDEHERAQLLGEASLELSELSALVAELVDLATDARAEEPLQRVELSDLTEQVVERARRRTGRIITFTAHNPASVDVRASACDRAITNLVDNACKFSPADTSIDVSVADTTIEVGDRGPGVAPEDREHVFDRFYRATSSRSMPGSGLGLSIVQQVAELHGGTVELLARAGGGTAARFTLPSTSDARPATEKS